MSRKSRPKGRRIHPGFSLLELLIVMGILLVISAMAVPYYMSAVQVAHEASAVGFLKHLNEAQERYRTAHGEYAQTFDALGAELNVRLNGHDEPQWASAGWVSVAIAAPLQGQGQGQGVGQGGTPPGQGGTPPGQGQGQGQVQGVGQGGTPPGQGQGQSQAAGQGGTPPTQGGTPPGQALGTPSSDSLVRSMYIFRLTRETPLNWHCIAEPLRDRTANKFFYIDVSGVLRYSTGSLPRASSPPL